MYNLLLFCVMIQFVYKLYYDTPPTPSQEGKGTPDAITFNNRRMGVPFPLFIPSILPATYQSPWLRCLRFSAIG